VTVVVAEAPTLDHPTGGPTRRRAAVPIEGTRFAHASEAELARILDFYMVRWEYEPRTFPILWNLDGTVIESFSPDFYLPDLDMWLELTTLRQSLVRRKNRKLRRMRELYPMIRIKLLYARDFRALMLKYGRLDVAASLIGTDGQVMPGDVVTNADRSRADVARSSPTTADADPITIA
jgi:hypoxanthine phosphoribosyltransferase